MKIKTDLFEYQRAAVEKLSRLRVGALYMEMGTGKTRVALELVKRRLDAGKVDMVIWLCPCSVKKNLKDDLNKHADEWENQITICGIETLSTSVSSYTELFNLTAEKTCFIIVDESNLIKNPYALRSIHIAKIAERCPYRLILNGTPIARNEADLFQQWYLLDWRILGYKSYYSFARNHIEYDPRIPGKVERVLNVGYLTDKIAPYTYQIKKSDCLVLPEKKYRDVYYTLPERHLDIYWQLADEYMMQIDEVKPESIYRLFGVLQHCISGIWVRQYKNHLAHEKIYSDPQDNPRITKLLEVLDSIGDQKSIIFCKYTREIDEIADILGEKAVKFYGELPLRKRQESIETFKSNAQYFIANKNCGAYGLNLQFCSNIIFYSNDWDFATRSQAEDRVHRIGQSNTVKIYDIVARDTLDQRILKCIYRKENLADSFKRNLANKKDMREWLSGREDLHE